MTEYSLRFDGVEITRVQLAANECDTQHNRDMKRRELAKEYGVPMHYLRLMKLNKKGARYVFTRGTENTQA